MQPNGWGFLRETRQAAIKAGIDKDTGLHRTGMEDYLAVIFLEIPPSEWFHDKTIERSSRRIRPDYRCERLKLMIEFDGVQHYQKPERIKADVENQRLYEELGYKVVRIPYFIQLSNDVVRQMFGRVISEPLFDDRTIDGHQRGEYAGLLLPCGFEKNGKRVSLLPQSVPNKLGSPDSCRR